MLVDRNELEQQLFEHRHGIGEVEIAQSKADLQRLLRSDHARVDCASSTTSLPISTRGTA